MLIRSSGDRDWRKFFFTLDVHLDGQSMADVVEADDEAGYLVRLVRDDAGRLIITRGGHAVARLEGVVVFVGQKRWSPDEGKAKAQAKRDRRQIRNLAVAHRNGGPA